MAERRNKKGSYVVFITLFFSSVMILIYAVIWVSGQKAVDSATDCYGRLWGRSILSEYDSVLEKRYGFFAYTADQAECEQKLRTYIDYSYGKKKYIRYSLKSMDQSEYKLADMNTFKSQIKSTIASGKSPVSMNVILKGQGTASGAGKKPGTASGAGMNPGTASGGEYGADIGSGMDTDKETGMETSGASGNDTASESGYSGHYISADWIIKALPSGGGKSALNVSGLTEKLKRGFSLSDLSNDYYINRYIFRFFRDYVNGEGIDDTYFNCEIEYIITGKLSDEKAYKSVQNNLLVLRNALNLVYLYSDTEKKEAVTAAALMITPGPEAVITEALIMEAWALMEARNDVKLLADNLKVPVFKSDGSWAISLQTVLSGEFGGEGGNRQTAAAGNQENAGSYRSGTGRDSTAGDQYRTENNENRPGSVGKIIAADDPPGRYIKPESDEGLTYDDYLRLLLTLVPEETKLLRMMDLIQINLKYGYCDYFLIDSCYTGVEYELEVNGRIHGFKETY